METVLDLSPSQVQEKIAYLYDKLEMEGLTKEEKLELRELKNLLDGEYMTDLEY